MLLDFMGLGGWEITILLVIIGIPFILIAYCVVDIVRSEFKTSVMKWVFLALVLFAPFLGSIIYLAMRRDYVKSNEVKHPFN